MGLTKLRPEPILKGEDDMPSHNPNNHNAYTIEGTGTLEGMSWGTHSGWNLPFAITTPYGEAVRIANQYMVTAMVIITRHGRRYHSQACRHAMGAVMRGHALLVTVEAAKAAGYRPCTNCTPHLILMVAEVVETASQPKSTSPWNERLMAVADSGYNGS